MRGPNDQVEVTSEAPDRRKALQEVRARLSAVSDDLSDSRIGAAQLRKDMEELTAVVCRIEWLADITDQRMSSSSRYSCPTRSSPPA
jgi:hypothetical protein